ncbi:unnamed protein product [Amoebophrya sp. A25]|nr:unnamed protein product [Amoebophrya sp. A25]|eukprot:GSA25T00008046001.1
MGITGDRQVRRVRGGSVRRLEVVRTSSKTKRKTILVAATSAFALTGILPGVHAVFFDRQKAQELLLQEQKAFLNDLATARTGKTSKDGGKRHLPKVGAKNNNPGGSTSKLASGIQLEEITGCKHVVRVEHEDEEGAPLSKRSLFPARAHPETTRPSRTRQHGSESSRGDVIIDGSSREVPQGLDGRRERRTRFTAYKTTSSNAGLLQEVTSSSSSSHVVLDHDTGRTEAVSSHHRGNSGSTTFFEIAASHKQHAPPPPRKEDKNNPAPTVSTKQQVDRRHELKQELIELKRGAADGALASVVPAGYECRDFVSRGFIGTCNKVDPADVADSLTAITSNSSALNTTSLTASVSICEDKALHWGADAFAVDRRPFWDDGTLKEAERDAQCCSLYFGCVWNPEYVPIPGQNITDNPDLSFFNVLGRRVTPAEMNATQSSIKQYSMEFALRPLTLYPNTTQVEPYGVTGTCARTDDTPGQQQYWRALLEAPKLVKKIRLYVKQKHSVAMKQYTETGEGTALETKMAELVFRSQDGEVLRRQDVGTLSPGGTDLEFSPSVFATEIEINAKQTGLPVRLCGFVVDVIEPLFVTRDLTLMLRETAEMIRKGEKWVPQLATKVNTALQRVDERAEELLTR